MDMPQAAAVQPEELPLVLTMKHVQEITGLSKPKVYELAHTRGFPVVRFGRALRVPRDAFLRWLNEQTGVQEG
jgi:excisionase family DNA binding protein